MIFLCHSVYWFHLKYTSQHLVYNVMCLYSLWRTSTNQNRRGAIKQSDTLDFPEGQTKDKQVC